MVFKPQVELRANRSLQSKKVTFGRMAMRYVKWYQVWAVTLGLIFVIQSLTSCKSRKTRSPSPTEVDLRGTAFSPNDELNSRKSFVASPQKVPWPII